MPEYEGYAATVGKIQSILVDKMLKPIAFRHFKQDRGVGVREVLPGRSSEYDFAAYGFDGYVDPTRRTLENPLYLPSEMPLTSARIAAAPHACLDLVDDLYDAWWGTFGEQTMAYQRDHPGAPPLELDDIKASLNGLVHEFEAICADPSLDDLSGAIRDKNYRVAARFLGVDDPQQLFSPGGGHELTDLFCNGEIHIVFHDDDIALLKPEYDFDTRANVWSQQRPRGERVAFRGETPESAFVVGIDDTPVGLFAHSVDGTRLDHDQTITRETLHDVMGFDRNYAGETRLAVSAGERVRLQGDLAVRQVSGETGTALPDRCNLPIDNHLVVLTNAVLPPDETTDEEPIRVHAPGGTTVNIVHDEHENVATHLPEGTYEFYLLPRGIQPARDRPDWPAPSTYDDETTNSTVVAFEGTR